jgi:hypothetical protein
VAHHAANPNSDHERGDAYDITVDYANGPDPDSLAEMARSDDRVSYVIWNQRIANKTIENNAWRPYGKTAVQTDPHTSHVHISIRHDARDDVRPWRQPIAAAGEPTSSPVAASVAPPAVAPPAPPAAKMDPVPPGFVNMPQSHVTPERAAWAQELLRDSTFMLGQVRVRAIGGPVAARVETHPADAHIDHPHRGISLYEPREAPVTDIA